MKPDYKGPGRRRTRQRVAAKSASANPSHKLDRDLDDALDRDEPTKRPPVPPEVQRLGTAASTRQRALAAGLSEDAPRNKHGQRCVEKVCVVCAETFLTPPSGASRRKACSPKCAAVYKKARTGATRLGESNPNYRHGKRAGERDRAREERWFAALGASCVHPDCDGTAQRLHLHHAIYWQELRRVGGDKWDPRNAVTLCERCHLSHHRRGRFVVPLRCLPDSVFEFAAEAMGAGPAFEYLRRRYEGEDARLNKLIEEAA